MTLQEATLEKLIYPLKKPYVLSFVTLTEFISIQLSLKIEGKKVQAEVVPLFGYNDFKPDDIYNFLEQWCSQAVGKSVIYLREEAAKLIQEKGFLVSPILTAIDVFFMRNALKSPMRSVEFITPFSSKDYADISFDKNREYKLKLSNVIEQDIHVLKHLTAIQFRSPIRTDANQIYTLDTAIDFFEAIIENKLENKIAYVEQPVAAQDWKSITYLRKNYPQISIMLDESIVSDQDIYRAKSIGINFIKLKLFKQGGIKELIQQAQLCKLLGINVVLGNGVATKLSNQIENHVFSSIPLFYGASEANGFLKLKEDGR